VSEKNENKASKDFSELKSELIELKKQFDDVSCENFFLKKFNENHLKDLTKKEEVKFFI